MNELEQAYRDKIDFIRYDVTTKEGYCELALHGFTHVPAMMFIDRNGKTVFTAEEFIDKEPLRQRYEDLIKR